jgi:glycosyltransferase involved in cell wall biosynthesis
MSKKTVVIYYAGFVRFGGVFSHVGALEAELRRIGWSVKVITLDSLPFWCRYIPHITEKLVNLISMPLGFIYKDRLTRGLYKLFFNLNVDLRIFEDIYLSWNSRITSITILHAVWSDNLQSYNVSEIQQRKLREREAEIIDNIKHPVATVSFSYLKYIREEHFPRSLNKKIEVIELGIDQSNFLKVGHPERRSIIYVGALEARKNVLFMLNVFKKLFELNSAFKLTVIGDGPQRKELVEFASSNRLPVNFMGKIPHQAVLLELPRHGIYLHTSVKESFSYSLLEAKLAGLKTCAYDKLQVPAGFIDVAIETFEVDRWCSGILNIDWKYAPFDAATYTVEKMTSKTLELAG